MFAITFVTALTAISMASARMDSRSETRRSNAPSHYAEGYLERYDVYHTRYVAIDCKAKHDTSFFDKCCHPMLASETLAKNRPAECNPANIKKASSTKVLNTAAPKATTPPVDDGEYCMEGDEDCVCEDEEETNDDECKEGDPDCVCEEEGEETSSSKPPAPPKSSSKPKAAATSTTKAVKSTQAPTDSGKARTGGVATYFWQNGNAGACGTKHQDTDFIAAIDKDLYGPDNKASQYCGRKILITRTDTGKTVTVTVADDCPSCINTNSIDLSHAAFNAIATDEEGQVSISWQWL